MGLALSRSSENVDYAQLTSTSELELCPIYLFLQWPTEFWSQNGAHYVFVEQMNDRMRMFKGEKAPVRPTYLSLRDERTLHRCSEKNIQNLGTRHQDVCEIFSCQG